MSIEDTLAELLFNFYEAAGFDREVLAQELFWCKGFYSTVPPQLHSDTLELSLRELKRQF